MSRIGMDDLERLTNDQQQQIEILVKKTMKLVSLSVFITLIMFISLLLYAFEELAKGFIISILVIFIIYIVSATFTFINIRRESNKIYEELSVSVK